MAALVLRLLTIIIIIQEYKELNASSQVSPKSTIYSSYRAKNPLTENHLTDPVENIESSTMSSTEYLSDGEKIETDHLIVERSANPVLNKRNARKFNAIVANDVDISDSDYSYIKPTNIQNKMISDPTISTDFSSQQYWTLKGRAIDSSERALPSNMTFANSGKQTYKSESQGRQSNPDIKDIITGIVKLLNGNVNVQANTQPAAHRPLRPLSTRINNRGPPRISTLQSLPPDFDAPISSSVPQSSMKPPPPYPFDRPYNHNVIIKPFLNGIPIPEQIVPTENNNGNYRPSMMSGKPHMTPIRRRPQPPPHGLPNYLDRPHDIPPYKPMPPMPSLNTTNFHIPNNQNVTVEEEENKPNVDTVEYVVSDPKENVTDIATQDNEKEVIDLEHLNSLGFSEPYYEIASTSTATEETKIENETTAPPVEAMPTTKSSLIITKKKDFPTREKTALNKLDKKQSQVVEVSSTTEVMTSSPSSSIMPTEILMKPDNTTSENTFLESSTPEIELPNPISVVESSETEILQITDLSTENTIAPWNTTSTSTSTYISSLPGFSSYPYPRPGIVLDDPEFKPGGHNRIQTSKPLQNKHTPLIYATEPLPNGYGEIFDVTVSAIQGPGGGSKQSVSVNQPFGGYPGTVEIETVNIHDSNVGDDIIVSPSGNEGFVSIDGKRTFINLFDDGPKTSLAINPFHVKPTPGIAATGYGVAEAGDPPVYQSPKLPVTIRPQPTVRIDTCIVGDDSTCDQTQHERCRTESGVSSCHCKPGYARRKHRELCRRVISLLLSLRVDKLHDRRIVWDNKLNDFTSEPYRQFSYEAIHAIDSAMSMTPFSDQFLDAKVNKISRAENFKGIGIFINVTLQLEESTDTLRPSLKNEIQNHLLAVIRRRNNNIGNSALYVESLTGSVSSIQDLDECSSSDLNDCHELAVCSNIWGTFRCSCPRGLRDPWLDQPQRAGRRCEQCPAQYCNNRGNCKFEEDQKLCDCIGNYYGSQCEIDGEVLGVAVGASVAAVIIIVLTLVCLVMWSRRWSREQKAVTSPVFGYLAGGSHVAKTPVMGQPPCQVNLEDRMRWAQIADVMAQSNHYAAEPIAAARPPSNIFDYHNLSTISMANTLPIHHANLQHYSGMMRDTPPPVPLPRLGLHCNRGHASMGTLDNTSSSEEEDRTDLLGRNFQVPRPKSRSNGSITNQSGIYYDVDYEPSGGELYPGLPMSTYTVSSRPPYYKQ